MKRLLSAIVFPAMFISISNVYALDIQPGEWKMENIEMRTINPDTKEVLMDEKNSVSLIFVVSTIECDLTSGLLQTVSLISLVSVLSTNVVVQPPALVEKPFTIFLESSDILGL